MAEVEGLLLVLLDTGPGQGYCSFISAALRPAAPEPTMLYHFQNPNDGHPMLLRDGDRGPYVELEECEQCDPHDGCSAAFDARDLNEALRGTGITDIHEAASYLKRQHDAKDILD